MELNFGRSEPFSLGIEEEFMLLSAESYELVSRFDEIAEAAGADERIKPELLQSTVEIATHVHSSVDAAVDEARGLRARLRDAAAERDALIASAGTHPFSRYEHQDVTEQERYHELIEAMQWVAERELIFGLHVHVGMQSADQAIHVANAFRTWLPELLALAANSPFWHGRETGLASTRSKVFDTFPRSGLPPAFASWEEYELLVDRGVRTNSFKDYTYIWWDLRPHPTLGTIEIRICDAVTQLEDVVAITALCQALVKHYSERYDAHEEIPSFHRILTTENKWLAARYGIEAPVMDLLTGRRNRVPVAQLVRRTVKLVQPHAEDLGSERELTGIEEILRRGNGADRQLRVFNANRDIVEVVREIAELTEAGAGVHA